MLHDSKTSSSMLLVAAVEELRGRVDPVRLRQRVLLDRALQRLVVLRERPVGERVVAEDVRDAVLLHDERQPPVGVDLPVRGLQRRVAAVDDVPGPLEQRRAGGRVLLLLLGLRVDVRHPLEQRALRVPGLAELVDRGAVVDDAPVDRPAPGPVRVEAEAGGVGLVVAVGHLVAGLRVERLAVLVLLRRAVGAAVDPGAAGGRPVGLERRERGDELPLLEAARDGLGLRVDELLVGEPVAVDLARHLRGCRASRRSPRSS